MLEGQRCRLFGGILTSGVKTGALTGRFVLLPYERFHKTPVDGPLCMISLFPVNSAVDGRGAYSAPSHAFETYLPNTV